MPVIGNIGIGVFPEPALEGVVFTDVIDEANPVLQRFARQWRARFAEPPLLLGLAAAHDLATTALEALRLAPALTAAGVRSGLERLRGLPAAVGAAGNHHRLRAVGSRRVQGPADRLPRDPGRARRHAPPVTRDSIVLCAGTIPRATFRERVAAARAGGFDGVSLRLGDYARARAEGLSDAELRALLEGEGLAVAEMEALTAWRPGITPARPEHAEPHVLAVAEAMRARSISVVEGPGAPLPVDVAAEAFAALCDRAAARGLLVHIEFWRGSGLDLADRGIGGRDGGPPERRAARRHLAPGAYA